MSLQHTCNGCCVRLTLAPTVPIMPTQPAPQPQNPPPPPSLPKPSKQPRAKKETVSKQGFSKDEVPITEGARLHYYRCWDCLEIGAAEEQLPYKKKGWNADARMVTEAQCACNGTIDYLGQTTVDRKRLEKEVEKSVCDARCTNATGPNCNCQCGCVNHGTGRVVKIVKTEALPRFHYTEDIEKSAILRGMDYRQIAKDLKQAVIDAKLPSYIPWSQRSTSAFPMSSQEADVQTRDLLDLTNYKNRVDRAKALYKKITGNDYQLLSARMNEPGAMDIDYRPTETMPEDFYAF